jgi:ATP-binding cassette, subfamily C (CFTR/MRP), member 1
MELQSGSIRIDDIDLSRVTRAVLRQRCFIAVPQDPYISSDATLRFNLDSSESLPDTVVTAALRKTQLWRHFYKGCPISTRTNSAENESSEIQDREPLDSVISDLPPLSTGQLQLLSLARAVLRAEFSRGHYSSSIYPDDGKTTKPILLLDEATSSLDPETDSVIQNVIEEEFTAKGNTVIVISHRSSVMGSGLRSGRERVVVLKNGRFQELFDAETSAGYKDYPEEDTKSLL